jgi:hypothetical protein
VGWVFVTKKEAEANGWDIKRCEEVIVNEVEYYDKYVSGEPVYRFEITGPELDDSYGEYDTEADAIESAKETIDVFILHLISAGITADVKYKEAAIELNNAIEGLIDAILAHALKQFNDKDNWAHVASVEKLTNIINDSLSLLTNDKEV